MTDINSPRQLIKNIDMQFFILSLRVISVLSALVFVLSFCYEIFIYYSSQVQQRYALSGLVWVLSVWAILEIRPVVQEIKLALVKNVQNLLYLQFAIAVARPVIGLFLDSNINQNVVHFFRVGIDWRWFLLFVYSALFIFIMDAIIRLFSYNETTKVQVLENQMDSVLISLSLAEQLAQAKADFLANMSHEIRTPMNAILGFSELALAKRFPNQAHEYFVKINRASSNLLVILNDVLELSKLESSDISLNVKVFNLYDLKKSLLLLFTDLNETKKNKFTITITSGVPAYVLGDLVRIEQILINLLGNATKFTENGEVALQIALQHLDAQQAVLQFCVMDTGIGISSKDTQKILQPFTQVDESIGRRYGGTGLGLTICQRLLKLMNSELKITSSLNEGSQFCFKLCLDLGNVSSIYEDKTYPENKFIDFKDIAQLSGLYVLIAEDNEFNKDLIQEFLDLTNIKYKMVNDGVAALEALTKEDFDLVLMDIHMPVMDGYTATREIKLQPRYVNLPIIALSAAVTKKEQVDCFAAGMIDFLEKPIIPAKLISTLSRHISLKDTPNITDAQLTELQAGLFDDKENSTTLDISYLKSMVGKYPVKLTYWLNYFIDTATENITELTGTIEAGQALKASEVGHRLKSLAYSVGARELGNLCAEIEQVGKVDDVTSLNYLLEQLNAEWVLLSGKVYIVSNSLI